MRIAVCGYIVRGPLGGLAWHHLQYVLGLHRMGHDVAFVEDSDTYESCYDPSADAMGTDPAYGLRFAAAAFERLGLGRRWAYYDEHTSRWMGPLPPRWLESCELLLDVSGVNPPRPWWEGIPARALIDTDPAFTQLRRLDEGDAAAGAHTAFFTFAANAGDGAELPDDGLPWRPTRQPVVIDAWPQGEARSAAPWTTVMQWDSYAEREHAGVRYGMKSRSFEDYLGLPECVQEERFALAVGSATAPRDRLREHGWIVLDPLEVTRTPWTFQAFVRASKGEFSVAKHGYVVSRSGWFSERTAGYLASGRPAVVQDTGFTRWLPSGRGLIAFTDLDGAAAGIEAVSADHRGHCEAARELAAAHFDHAAVLGELLAAAT
jgi:hypothetical protein